MKIKVHRRKIFALSLYSLDLPKRQTIAKWILVGWNHYVIIYYRFCSNVF